MLDTLDQTIQQEHRERPHACSASRGTHPPVALLGRIRPRTVQLLCHQRGISLLVSKDANIFPLSQRTRAWNSLSFNRDSSLSLHLLYLGIATGDGVPQHGGDRTKILTKMCSKANCYTGPRNLDTEGD